jgi:exodeoxyribonuclease VII small subunit
MSKKNRSFEENMIRLEQIVRAMEKGDVPLEESLKLFQEGTELVRSCESLLEKAQQQVVKIVAQEDGTPAEEAFSDETDI